jgi:hypothetical protein
MAVVRLVVNFAVKPGRYAELFEGLKGLKKVTERLGANFTANRVRIGAEPTHIIAVGQWADLAAWAKAATDSELLRFLETQRSNANPPYESFTTTLVEEVPL